MFIVTVLILVVGKNCGICTDTSNFFHVNILSEGSVTRR